jgi:hypothetical protein
MRRRGFLLALLLGLALEPVQAADPLQVRLQLVDGEQRALAGVELRAVSTLEAGWRLVDAGQTRITGEDGTACWLIPHGTATRKRKRPTNFFTQLFAPRRTTQHTAIAVELDWLGRPWRVVFAGDRFADGTTAQLDGLRMYGRDEAGSFSRPVIQRDGAWEFPGVPGRLTTTGFTVQYLSLEHEARGWTLDLGVQRHADPVPRQAPERPGGSGHPSDRAGSGDAVRDME